MIARLLECGHDDWPEGTMARMLWACIGAALALGTGSGGCASSESRSGSSTGGEAGASGGQSGDSVAGGTEAGGANIGGATTAGDSSCPAGSETCPCYGNGTCDGDLTCASNLCVALGASRAGGASGSSASAGSAGSGATSGNGARGGSSDAGATPSGGDAGTTAGGSGGGGGVSPPCSSVTGLDDCEPDFGVAQWRRANLLLVVDKSGSMQSTPEGYGTNKWHAMTNALSAVLSDVRGTLNLGLEFFPATGTDVPIPPDCASADLCCAMPSRSRMDVDIGPGETTVPEILALLSAVDPAGGTPTAIALAHAAEYFDWGPGSSLEGDRYVLLATDGGPNCNPDVSCTVEECTLNIEDSAGCPPDGFSCCDNNATACLDHDETLTQIQNLADLGVQTIVVGIPGTEVYGSRLDAYAEAGGFQRPDGETGYYAVASSGGAEALADTLREVTTSLVDLCEILVSEPFPNPNQVNVAVDCVLVPCGEPADSGSHWYFDDPEDPSLIILDGPICDTIRRGDATRIDLLFGCPPTGPD